MSASPAAQLIGQEITVGSRDLMIESLVAEGGFGSVYLATDLATQEKLILKKMFANGPEMVAQLTNEVRLMERLSHPNVVRVLGSDIRKRGSESVEILVLLEWCPGGHMLTRLNGLRESGRKLTWNKILEVYLQMVRPVAYLHALPTPVAHRDLKFENVLIAADGTLRLCDFGSVSEHRGIIADKSDRAEQEDAILRYTTPHFRAPEMIDLYSGQPLDERTDVWALGCMLYGIAYFSHPFQETGSLAILSARYKLPTQPAFAAPIHTIIRACLQYRPDRRPTAAQLMQYIEECLKVTSDAGPFPALKLSGGGSVPSASVPTPMPGADGALPDGGVMITASDADKPSSAAANGASSGSATFDGGFDAFGNSGDAFSSGAAASTSAARKPAAKPHALTAQEIAAQALQAAAATSGPKSGALAARMAKNKSATPGALVSAASMTPAVAPVAASHHASSSSSSFSSASASTPAAAATFGSDFDAFSAIGFDAPASAPSSSTAPSRNRAPSGDAAPSSFDDFFSSPAPAPAASGAAANGATALDDPFAAISFGDSTASSAASKPASSPFDF